MRVISWVKAAQKDFEKMKKEQIEVVRGSDNPFRDAGLPNPELENARATLAAEIIGILNERNLSKRKAASITGNPSCRLTACTPRDENGPWTG